MTIRKYFENAVENYPDKVFLRWNDGVRWNQCTFLEVLSRVKLIHAAIRRELARRGHASYQASEFPPRVIIQFENSPEWIALYLAVAGSGLIAVPVDPHLNADEIHHIVTDSSAAIVFDRESSVRDMIDDLNDEERRGSDALWEGHRPQDDDVASIIYTSGTTGRPKGAMLTHANFCANTEQVFPRVMFYDTDRFLLVLPLFHAFAFTLDFLMPLRKGCEIAFARGLRTVAQDIAETKPTAMMAVPHLAEMLYKHAKGVICSLRVLGVGGAPLDVKTIDGLRAAGVYVLEGYGITECAPGVCYPKDGYYVPGTVGVPLDGMEWRICNSDDTGAGELRVKGPNVMRGYWNNPEETAAAFDTDGFYRTGDIVRTAKDGNIAICGRIKALIVNREGKNIYPEEIERVLGRERVIADVIAIGYTRGTETGEHVGVIVVPSAAAVQEDPTLRDCSREEIIHRIRERALQRCHENLAEYKCPRKIEIRFTPLERTATQKVKRYLYRHALDE